MTKNEKIAILLNAVVIPGSGQLLLGSKAKGAILMLASLFFIVLPVAKYVMFLSFALNMIDRSNLSSLAQMAYASSVIWPSVKMIVYLSASGLFIVWLYGIADIFIKRSTND